MKIEIDTKGCLWIVLLLFGLPALTNLVYAGISTGNLLPFGVILLLLLFLAHKYKKNQQSQNMTTDAIMTEEPEDEDFDEATSSVSAFLTGPMKLQAELKEYGSVEGVAQLQKLRQKYDNLAEILRRRLNAGELTYERYLKAAEKVYLAALDNLHEVAVALKSVSTIEPSYIDDRLAELRKIPDPTDEQKGHLAALEERRSLMRRQTERVANLLAQNESAMTALDKTAAAFAELKTGKGRASVGAELAVEELERLAKRVRKYKSQ